MKKINNDNTIFEKLISSIDELIVGQNYKIDSHLGGSFTLKYLGTIINNKDINYGKHIFFQELTSHGFGNAYYYYTDEQVLKNVHSNNSSIYETNNKKYNTLWYAIRNDFTWDHNDQEVLKNITWTDAVKQVKEIAKALKKEVRLSMSKGFNNQGYYFHPQMLENNNIDNNITKLVNDFAEILQNKVNDYYDTNYPSFKEKNMIPEVKVLPGKTYIKINIGDSGKFMVDINDGLLYFIKGYGVIDRKKVFGSIKNLINSDFVYDGYSINKPGIPKHAYGYAGRITENKLRSVTIKYENGDTVNTSMAAHLTDEEIYDYFKIGKSFNIGIGPNDNISKVKEVIINESLEGGLADNMTISDIDTKHKVSIILIKQQLEKGIKIEMEHTNDKEIAMDIAMDHLVEIPDYYNRLEQIENDIDYKKYFNNMLSKFNIKNINELTKKQWNEIDNNWISKQELNESVYSTIVDKIIKLYYNNIHSVNDVKVFISMLYYDLNLNLHPDDNFEDYILNNIEMFTLEQSAKLNKIMDDSFDTCNQNDVDIYEIVFNIIKPNSITETHDGSFGGDDSELNDLKNEVLDIRIDGTYFGHVTKDNDIYITHGQLGDGNTFNNITDLKKYLATFKIADKNMYWNTNITENIGKSDIINILIKYTNWLNNKQLLETNNINNLVNEFMGINETYNIMSIVIPDKKNWLTIIEPKTGKDINAIEVFDNIWAIKDTDVDFFKTNIGKTIKFKYLKDNNIKYIQFIQLI